MYFVCDVVLKHCWDVFLPLANFVRIVVEFAEQLEDNNLHLGNIPTNMKSTNKSSHIHHLLPQPTSSKM